MPMYAQGGPMMNYEAHGNGLYPQPPPMHMRGMPGAPQGQMRMMNPNEMPHMRPHFPEGNIIKNSQNPNAPPTYICGTCGVECHENDQVELGDYCSI